MSYGMTDSGERVNYDTGAVREDRTGKGRYDLLSPIALARLARVAELGAEKYDDRNWEKGIPVSRFIDSAIRHTLQYVEGRDDEDHLAHAMWNLMAALHTEEMVKREMLPFELIDLPAYNL